MITRGYTVTLLLVALAAGGNAAEYAADFLYLGVGARSAGMGGACATSTEGPESCYWNAAVDYRTGNGLMAEQAFQFGGLSSWQTLFGKLAIGPSTGISAGVILNRIDDLQRYNSLPAGRDLTQPEHRSDFIPLGNFSASSLAGLINVARRTDFNLIMRTGLLPTALPASFQYGLNLKFISERIDDNTGSAMTSDVGFRLIINGPTVNKILSRRRIVMVLNLQNALGGSQKWDTPANTSEQLHRNFRLGFAWEGKFTGRITGLRLAAERDSYSNDVLHLGGEMELQELLLLRCGGDGTRLSRLTPSFGVGIRFRNLQADYAFRQHPDLDKTHRLSVAYIFNQ